MKRHYPRVLVVIAACALLVAACGSPNTSNKNSSAAGNAGTPHPGGSVTIAIEGTDLANLNTQMTSNTGPLILADLWADGLFAYDANGNRVPHLATSSAVTPNGLTYTLKLRPDVKFSDGTPFSSADVAYDLDVLAKFNTYLTNVLPKIKNVATPDATTVVITLNQPFAPFLAALDKEVFPILPKHVYEQGDPATNPANTQPVGLGPFKYESTQSGRSMTFVRNPNYWDAPRPYLDKVLVTYIPDQEQQVNALLKGEVDWTKLAYPDVKRVKDAADSSQVTVESREVKAPETMVLDLNTTRGALQQAAVRKALYTAIDRTKIIQDAYDGFAELPKSAIPTDFTALYDPTVDYTKTYAFDAAAAANALDAAGLPMKDGKRFSVTLSYVAGDAEYPFDAVARIVAAQWKSIGVDVKLDGLDSQVWSDKVYTNRDFDVSLISLTGRTDPVLGVDRSFLCNDKRLPYVNPTGYCDPKLDALALQAQQAADADRKALYGQYEQLVSDALPQLPLASADVFEGVSSKFGDIEAQFNLAYNGHANWAAAYRS